MYFLRKAHHSYLMHRNTRQHFSTSLGGILNSKATNKKHKNAKKMFSVDREGTLGFSP